MTSRMLNSKLPRERRQGNGNKFIRTNKQPSYLDLGLDTVVPPTAVERGVDNFLPVGGFIESLSAAI